MCIILYNHVGKRYDREMLSTAYDNNPHGFGIMWTEDQQVKTLRGLFSKEKMFEIMEHFVDVPHVLHMRWRTRGKIEKDQCHPFRASHADSSQQVYMMHNGTFHHITQTEKLSDTYIFAERMRGVTKDFGYEMLFNESFLRNMEKEIMSWNKVIFLRDDGKVAIMNPSSWHNIDGIMASNTYSLIKDYRKTCLMTEYLSKTTSNVKEAEVGPLSKPVITQGGGKVPDWLVKSIAWEKAQKEKAERERAKILMLEKDIRASDVNQTKPENKKTLAGLRKERKKIEREISARTELENERTRYVVRRRKHEDGSIEIIPCLT